MSSLNTGSNNEQSCGKEGELSTVHGQKTDSSLVHKFSQLVSTKVDKHIQAKRLDTRRAVQECKVVKPIYFKSEDAWRLLSIFPEEVWTMILCLMRNKSDFHNSEKSCQLFCRILHDYKKQWMFPEIVHLVHKYLTKADFLTSRLVCKEWRQGVDQFFENVRGYGAKNQYWPTAIEQAPSHWKNVTPQFEQVYKIPITPTMEQRNGAHQVLILTMDHQQNPFVGSSVDIYSRVRPNQDEQALLIPSYNMTLKKLGIYIRHLSVTLVAFSQTEITTSPFSLCSTVLNGAPNLKTLSLNLHGFRSYVCTKQDDSVFFPNHAFFESLKFWNEANSCGQLLTQLMEKYHTQIKHARVYYPDFEIDSSLLWNELTSLSVHMYFQTQSYAQTFGIFSAPNLRRLTVDLGGKFKTLHELMKLLQGFPKLEFLELIRCSELLTASDAQVLNLPHEICCSVSIKELQIHVFILKITTFQFLRCLPLLNKLQIRHDWPEWHNRRMNQSLDVVPGVVAVIEPEYFGGDQENYNENSPLMLKSNVWKVLPELVRLENKDTWGGGHRVYTRKEYLSSNSV